jgi:CrcB protein
VTPTLREALIVACGGALGSVARFVVGSAMTRWYPSFPLGTLLVNVIGCFLMGMLAGWTSDRTLRAALGVVVMC